MVDIPEKLIDNSNYLNQDTELHKSINAYQIEKKAVGINKYYSRAVDKRITKKSVKWNLVNK